MARIGRRTEARGSATPPTRGNWTARNRGKPLARHGRRAVPVRTITRSRYVTPGGLPTLVRRIGAVMWVTELTGLAIGATSDRPDSPVIDRYSIVLECDNARGSVVRNATELVHRSRTAPLAHRRSMQLSGTPEQATL